MSRTTKNRLAQVLFTGLSFALFVTQASAQNVPETQNAPNTLKTNSRMIYHDGPVRTNVQPVYVIYYGCWSSSCGLAGDAATITVVSDFLSTIGNTPYMKINSTYSDSTGQSASAALVFAGSVFDSSYSHGVDLTEADIAGIIQDQITSFQLPQDPQGIYVVIASADVASTETGFCSPGAPPFHSSAVIWGGRLPFIFLGNPNRCPSLAGAFTGQSSPNGSFAGDALVMNITHALNGLLTDPFGNAWYDRYGLENADKCTGTFGQTYTTANGARANIHLNVRDFLIEQNWVNTRKGACVMF